jgi:hypothetical protein
VIAAYLLLPGHPMRNLNQVTAHLHPYLRRRVATTLRDLQADGHQQILAAVCQLADYLDHHGSPDRLPPPPRRNRPMPVRQALTDHATRHLGQLGIDEPLTWEPPARCCQNLELPGRDPDDIDLDVVHQLVVADHLPPASQPASSAPPSTTSGWRWNAPPHPAPPGANTPPMAWQRGQRAQRPLTREFFEHEYLAGRKRLAQIAIETGLPKKLVAPTPTKPGSPCSPAMSHPIAEGWLRQQYLDRKRSFPDIAAELGVFEMTVNRAAHRYRIPIRPAGVTSHPEMLRTLDPNIPRDIRRAVEGGLWGWQRLRRFQQAMGFPTIEEATDHLGVHQAALVRQLQRLERDIGAQLYHSAVRAQPLRPTRRGAALLNALDQPAVRALVQQMPDR